jgi:hypothetical protein
MQDARGREGGIEPPVMAFLLGHGRVKVQK